MLVRSSFGRATITPRRLFFFIVLLVYWQGVTARKRAARQAKDFVISLLGLLQIVHSEIQ